MGAKHTPGPWKIDRSIPEEGFECFFITTEYWPNKSICDCPGPHIKEKEANARLIAAAPELLEALRGILNSDRTRIGYDEYEGARAAISKATGEQ